MKLIIYVNPDKLTTLINCVKDNTLVSQLSKKDVSITHAKGCARAIIDEQTYFLLLDNELI